MDICFLIDPDNKIVIHCHGVKGATWFAKHLTTNVAPLYCEPDYGWKVLQDMFDDGLKISMKDGDGKNDAAEGDPYSQCQKCRPGT